MPGAAEPPSSGSTAVSVLIPITWLERLTSAPPLLPGLIAAEVCTMLPMVAPGEPGLCGSVTVRPTAETMPSVTLLDRPSGLPMASVTCPTATLELSAKVAGLSPLGGLLSLITARSDCG